MSVETIKQGLEIITLCTWCLCLGVAIGYFILGGRNR